MARRRLVLVPASRRRVLIPDAVTWKGSSVPLKFADQCLIRVWLAKKRAKFQQQKRSKRSKKNIGDDDDGGMEEGAEKNLGHCGIDEALIRPPGEGHRESAFDLGIDIPCGAIPGTGGAPWLYECSACSGSHYGAPRHRVPSSPWCCNKLRKHDSCPGFMLPQ